MTAYLCVLYSKIHQGQFQHHGMCPDLQVQVGPKKTREDILEELRTEMARKAIILQIDFQKPLPEPTTQEQDIQPNGAHNLEFVHLEPRPLPRVVLELHRALQRSGLSISEVARRMETSRQAVHRLLDPSYSSHTLDTVQRFARAVQQDLEIKVRPSRAEYDLKSYDEREAPLATTVFRTIHQPWARSVTLHFVDDRPLKFEKAEADPLWRDEQHLEFHTLEELLEAQHLPGSAPTQQAAWKEYVRLHQESLAYLQRISGGNREQLYGMILQHWYLPIMFPQGIQTSP